MIFKAKPSKLVRALDCTMRVSRIDVLEKMQPRPVPLVVTLLQHAATCGAPQDEALARGWGSGTGLGRADAAMATERTLRRVLDCIFLWVEGRFEGSKFKDGLWVCCLLSCRLCLLMRLVDAEVERWRRTALL